MILRAVGLRKSYGDGETRVDAVVDEVDGAAGDPGAVRERVPHAVGPGETGEQGGMRVDGPPAEPRQELLADVD